MQYEELARKTGMLKMMLLKFKITRSPDLIHRVLSNLDDIGEVEQCLLQGLVKKLR